jgi:hypothetical protein
MKILRNVKGLIGKYKIENEDIDILKNECLQRKICNSNERKG